MAIGGGLGWMKWLKNGAEKGFIFHAIIPALGIGTGYGLNILHKFNKGVIVEKVRGLIPTFVKVTWEKLVGDFLPPLYWRGLR